jgi:hypothetical protein
MGSAKTYFYIGLVWAALLLPAVIIQVIVEMRPHLKNLGFRAGYLSTFAELLSIMDPAHVHDLETLNQKRAYFDLAGTHFNTCKSLRCLVCPSRGARPRGIGMKLFPHITHQSDIGLSWGVPPPLALHLTRELVWVPPRKGSILVRRCQLCYHMTPRSDRRSLTPPPPTPWQSRP